MRDKILSVVLQLFFAGSADKQRETSLMSLF